jgi:hypothetical protein
MCEDVAGAVHYRDINPAAGTLPEKMGLELRPSPVIVDDLDLDIEWLKMGRVRSNIETTRPLAVDVSAV